MARIAYIGFGEAGAAFAQPGARTFDIKTDDPTCRDAKIAEFESAGVDWRPTPQAALAYADAILCLVTADQALAVAQRYAAMLPRDALWLDMNSVAPGTKRNAAEAIGAAGARYVDVAVMAPVLPARLNVPLLVAGPDAAAGTQLLAEHGFTRVSVAGPAIGDASAIKMIRSVMVKGIEALSAECALAAQRAGVLDAVIASLDASWKEQGWADRIDYNLDRMLAHGTRRAAEMKEVVRTLDDLGVEPAMSRATVQRQRALGALEMVPPEGLRAKISSIAPAKEDQAA